jgi:hypothetical protein
MIAGQAHRLPYSLNPYQPDAATGDTIIDS